MKFVAVAGADLENILKESESRKITSLLGDIEEKVKIHTTVKKGNISEMGNNPMTPI
jgi:copper(I)-binding protein